MNNATIIMLCGWLLISVVFLFDFAKVHLATIRILRKLIIYSRITKVAQVHNRSKK